MSVCVMIAIIALWVGGDMTYSKVIDHRLAKWEQGVQRNENGLRPGTESFSVGQGSTALLMIHGFGDSAALYQKMAPALAERGYTCRAIRLPGFGEPMERYAQVGNKEWLAEIKRELTALRESHERVLLVAHSLGGALSLRYVLEQEDEAEGIVLMAPLIKVSSARSPLLPPRTWYTVSRKMFKFQIMESPFAMNLEHSEYADYPRDRFIPRNVYDAMFETMGCVEDRAGDLKLPLLMILAGKDAVIDSKKARTFFKDAASEQKKLIVMEDVAHAFPLDRGWEEVVAEIDAFARLIP